MYNLIYKRMLREDDADIPQLIAIHQTSEITQYLNISNNYFHYVTNNENVYYFKVYANNQLIGAIHLETQSSVLFMDILVFPEFQNIGLGTRIVKDIQNDVFGLGFKSIEISIDERNAASLRLFEKEGFIRTSKDDELITFVYQRRVD